MKEKGRRKVRPFAITLPAVRKACPFCSQNIDRLDYKELKMLRGFLSPFMKIEPRRRSGVCAKHQRMVAKALKRARHLALLPFTLR